MHTAKLTAALPWEDLGPRPPTTSNSEASTPRMTTMHAPAPEGEPAAQSDWGVPDVSDIVQQAALALGGVPARRSLEYGGVGGEGVSLAAAESVAETQPPVFMPLTADTQPPVFMPPAAESVAHTQPPVFMPLAADTQPPVFMPPAAESVAHTQPPTADPPAQHATLPLPSDTQTSAPPPTAPPTNPPLLQAEQLPPTHPDTTVDDPLPADPTTPADAGPLTDTAAVSALQAQLHDSAAREAHAAAAMAALRSEHAQLLTALQQAGTLVSIVGEAVALKAEPSVDQEFQTQLEQLVAVAQRLQRSGAWTEGVAEGGPQEAKDANGWGFEEDEWGDEAVNATVNGVPDADQALQQLVGSECAAVAALAAVLQGMVGKQLQVRESAAAEVQDAHAHAVGVDVCCVVFFLV